jgi:hypothetical protein
MALSRVRTLFSESGLLEDVCLGCGEGAWEGLVEEKVHIRVRVVRLEWWRLFSNLLEYFSRVSLSYPEYAARGQVCGECRAGLTVWRRREGGKWFLIVGPLFIFVGVSSLFSFLLFAGVGFSLLGLGMVVRGAWWRVVTRRAWRKALEGRKGAALRVLEEEDCTEFGEGKFVLVDREGKTNRDDGMVWKVFRAGVGEGEVEGFRAAVEYTFTCPVYARIYARDVMDGHREESDEWRPALQAGTKLEAHPWDAASSKEPS